MLFSEIILKESVPYIKWVRVKWINLAKNGDQETTVLKSVMNVKFHEILYRISTT